MLSHIFHLVIFQHGLLPEYLFSSLILTFLHLLSDATRLICMTTSVDTCHLCDLQLALADVEAPRGDWKKEREVIEFLCPAPSLKVTWSWV